MYVFFTNDYILLPSEEKIDTKNFEYSPSPKMSKLIEKLNITFVTGSNLECLNIHIGIGSNSPTIKNTIKHVITHLIKQIFINLNIS